MAFSVSRLFLWLFACLFCVAATANAQTLRSGQGLTSPSAGLLSIEVPDEPITVSIGTQISQITGVDQRAENFSVVAQIYMEWTDPRLSQLVPPGRDFLTMFAEDFAREAWDRGISVPGYIFENQQTRGFTKQSTIVLTKEGFAIHVRDEILTLQAPDFNFSDYPFDIQTFYLRIRALGTKEFVVFDPLPGRSGMGEKLGEEEWVIKSVWTEVQDSTGITGAEHSEFVLGFTADRHLIYYWTRIFLPLFLLIGVSWANLFLEEYRRRIDIASGNLLAFIALNFTISTELPRLGYITFLDMFLGAMFVLSALAVGYNVALRRMSVRGHEPRARKIDWHITMWGYPLLYTIVIGAIIIYFELWQ